jgi:hypothetical protein
LSQFPATGITTYLHNGGKLGVTQQIAGQEVARTAGIDDRSHDAFELGEVAPRRLAPRPLIEADQTVVRGGGKQMPRKVEDIRKEIGERGIELEAQSLAFKLLNETNDRVKMMMLYYAT